MKNFSLIFAAFCIAASAAAARESIRIGGSDLMEPELREALERQLEFLDIEVEIQLAGTYRARERLRAGEYDLAFLAIPDGEEISDEGLRIIPFAYKTVLAAVPQGNPLNEISMAHLAGVFGEGEATSISRWGQLGLTGEWTARTVEPVALTPVRHSLVLDLFRHTGMTSPRLRRGISYMEDLDGVRRRFEQDNNAIALLPGPANAVSGMKILPISPRDAERAVAPTADSIHNGEYPLRLPVYLAFSPEKGSELREILRFLVGGEAAEALETSGLTPLPELHRQRLYFEFERL